MNDIRATYLTQNGGDYAAAAVAFASDLMQDHRDSFKQGYTLENAAIAASEIFPAMSRAEIEERLNSQATEK